MLVGEDLEAGRQVPLAGGKVAPASRNAPATLTWCTGRRTSIEALETLDYSRRRDHSASSLHCFASLEGRGGGVLERGAVVVPGLSRRKNASERRR